MVIRDLRLAAMERPAEWRALIKPITKIQAHPRSASSRTTSA